MSQLSNQMERVFILVTIPIFSVVALSQCSKKKDEKPTIGIEDTIIKPTDEQRDSDSNPESEDDDGNLPTSQTCSEFEANSVRWTRSYQPDPNTPERQVEGSRTLEMRAGKQYGQYASNAPNIGYTNRAGTLQSGSPSSPGPESLKCVNNRIFVAWKYSNNVGGLELVQQVQISQKLNKDGKFHHLLKKGQIKEVFLDPKDSYPYKADPTEAYYNEASNRLFLTSQKAIGTTNSPFELISQKSQNGSDTQTQELKVWTTETKPLEVLSSYTLRPSRKKFSVVIHSGEMQVLYPDGLQATLSPTHLVLGTRPELPLPTSGRCTPQDGILETRYKNENKKYAFWVKEAYGSAKDTQMDSGSLLQESQDSKIWFGCDGDLSVTQCAKLVNEAVNERYTPRCLLN